MTADTKCPFSPGVGLSLVGHYLTEAGQFSFFGLQPGAATESPISAAWPVPSPELSTWAECVRFIHVTVRFTRSTLDSIRHLSSTPPCLICEAGADCARGQDGGDGKARGGQHNRRHGESQADHGCERKPDQATPAERRPRLRRVISAASTPPMIKPPIAPTIVGTPRCSCCSATAVIMAAAAPVATGHSHQKLMA
jgi:hypothetical protein